MAETTSRDADMPRDATQMTERDQWIVQVVLRSVWDYLLSDEGAQLPAYTVAEIVKAARVIYSALGGGQ